LLSKKVVIAWKLGADIRQCLDPQLFLDYAKHILLQEGTPPIRKLFDNGKRFNVITIQSNNFSGKEASQRFVLT
jgi:hypothetical protein